MIFDQEIDLGFGAGRVPDDVVNTLLEDQKTSRRTSVPISWSAVGQRRETEFDLTCGEDIAGEPAHALCQVAQPIAVGVDRPDDVIHPVKEVAREAGDRSSALRRAHPHRVLGLSLRS